MLVLGSVVRGRYNIKSEIIFEKKYVNLVGEDFQVDNIEYCEARNIRDRFRFNEDTFTIDIDLDLIIIYEYMNSGNNLNKLYGVINEKVTKTIKVSAGLYGTPAPYDSLNGVKCFNLYNDIVYKTEIAPSMRDLDVSICMDVDSFILQNRIVDIKGYEEGTEKVMDINENDTCNKCGDIENETVDDSTTKSISGDRSDLYEALDDGYEQCSSDSKQKFVQMMEQVMKEIDSVKKLESNLKEKDNQINFYEYYKETLENDYHKLYRELNGKISNMDALKSQINDNEYVLFNLNERLRKLENELKSYKKENVVLKERLKEQIEYKKNGFINKIRSHMGNKS